MPKMSSESRHISPTHEEVLIEQLRSQVRDLVEDNAKLRKEVYLLQWLKARKMNVNAAESAIRMSTKWRKENGIDKLAQEDFSPEAKSWFMCTRITGEDRTGAQFFTMPAGLWDVYSFIAQFGKESFVRFMTQLFIHGEQQMIDYSERITKERRGLGQGQGPICKGLTGVVSGTGYSLKQLRSLEIIKAAMECARIYDNYFPQHVDVVYFINVSKIFMVVMKMMTPFLRGTIHVFGGDQGSWKPQLLKHIAPEQLPLDYGGTRVLPS